MRPRLEDYKRRMDGAVDGVACLLSGWDDLLAIVDASHLFPDLNRPSIADAPEITVIKAGSDGTTALGCVRFIHCVRAVSLTRYCIVLYHRLLLDIAGRTLPFAV